MAKNSPIETRTSRMAYCSKSLLTSSAKSSNRFQSISRPSIGGCAATISYIMQFDFSVNPRNRKLTLLGKSETNFSQRGAVQVPAMQSRHDGAGGRSRLISSDVAAGCSLGRIVEEELIAVGIIDP